MKCNNVRCSCKVRRKGTVRRVGVVQCFGEVTDLSLPSSLAGPLKDLNLPMPLTHQSVKRYLRQHHQQIQSTVRKIDLTVLQPDTMALVGMHLSLTTTTPFSVKDILKLEHHHDFENDCLITDQVVPMNCQHVSRPRDLYDCQAEQCVSGMQEKLHIHNSAAEEEIHEQGEITLQVI